jgi:hypothetical protein
MPDLLIDRRVLMYFLHVLPYVTCTPKEKVDRPIVPTGTIVHSFDARLWGAMQQALLGEWLLPRDCVHRTTAGALDPGRISHSVQKLGCIILSSEYVTCSVRSSKYCDCCSVRYDAKLANSICLAPAFSVFKVRWLLYHEDGGIPLARVLDTRSVTFPSGRHTKSVSWVRERTIPTQRPRLPGEVNAIFADRGCHIVSVTDPYARIHTFLDRSRYVFFKVAPQLYSRGWMDPVPDPLLLGKRGSTGNRIRTSGFVTRNSDH